MRLRFLLCITVLLACHPLLWAQALTNQFPPEQSGAQPPAPAPAIPAPATDEETPPDAPASQAQPAQPSDEDQSAQPAFSEDGIPIARPVPPTPAGEPVHIAANLQTREGDIYTLTGDVEIDYRGYRLYADKVTYDKAANTVEAEGHLRLEGGPDQEQVTADHGTIDLERQTAHFFDVIGTVRLARSARPKPGDTIDNPLIFTGREVFKDGPGKYRVIDGSITSCQLPKPDWRLVAARIMLDKDRSDGGRATARNTYFTLLRVPLFYLPYMTHPVDAQARQSGFLIPTFGNSSSKGIIFGEEYYWAINRSTDMTIGSEYYSERGFAPRAEFRMRGLGLNFLSAHFHSLLDRRSGTANQGGVDLLVDGRHDFSPNARGILDLEYLSSYVYRQAFEENFSLAISSEVKSQAFATHEADGVAETLRFSRYQSFENNTPPLTEIRILHTPTLEAEAVSHRLGNTPLLWSFSSSLGGLSRSEPGLQKLGEVLRLDLYPHLAMPWSANGWNFLPEIALRETAYSKSQVPGAGLPVERDEALNRRDFEAGFEVHPPVIERDFTPPWLLNLLGGPLRHTIESDVKYRYVGGVNNFNSVLRFDDTDIVSDTSELEYAITQRLFVRSERERPCKDDEAVGEDGKCGGGTIDWLSWKVAQKYFFHPDFGGAVVSGVRNVLWTTLDLTGVAFLTEPRFLSPVTSRIRLRTSSATDLEWDLDYDPRLGRITASDLFASYRHDDYNFAIGHARLDAPELSPTSPQNLAAAVSNYDQLRLLFSYGNSARRGLSAGANGGYDFTLNQLQFGGIQSSYNWNCCGISLEYRRYNLGTVRNENQYLYSFSLSGIGTAGNLRRAERIF